jgi:phosphohistidine phosphatase
MKELLIVRHAKSSWDFSGLSDIDRPLNERGIRDAVIMADHLKKKELTPDLLISSPAHRAMATSSFLINHMSIKPEMVKITSDIYESSATSILNVVNSISDYYNRVFLVGHNPGLTDFVNLFFTDFLDNLPTCGVAYFQFNTSNWKSIHIDNAKLLNLWFPKSL